MNLPIRPSEDLRMGLIKSVFYSNAVEEYDPDNEFREDESKKPVPRVVARAAWTGLVLQLVSIFDDGLEDFLEQRYPDQACRTLSQRVSYLKARGHFRWPDRIQRLLDLRNNLAHEANFLAHKGDWRQTFTVVRRELEDLGVVQGLEAPPELLHQQEREYEDEEDE